MDQPEIKLSVDLTQVANDLYADALSDPMKAFSVMAVEIIDTARLALFPIQFTAMWQRRLAGYLKRAAEAVPENDRGSPVPALTLQIADKLRYHAEDDVLSEMYVKLLTLSFDKRRFGTAHPAFVTLIPQLCGDEAALIEALSDRPPLLYLGREPLPWASSIDSIKAKVAGCGFEVSDNAFGRVLEPDVFAEPKYLQTFIQHLNSLGIVEYVNLPRSELVNTFSHITDNQCWHITLTAFGRMFHEACMAEPLSASQEDRI